MKHWGKVAFSQVGRITIDIGFQLLNALTGNGLLVVVNGCFSRHANSAVACNGGGDEWIKACFSREYVYYISCCFVHYHAEGLS